MAIKNYAENWEDTYKSYLGSINFSTTNMAELVNAIREYVSLHTPEGVNDWQQSSEIGIFTNAVAYLGENLMYRLDLNVNDLFPSSTTREQSLLNFTKLLSYASNRNICSNGIAKIISVSTTQDVVDNSGILLKGATIKWNDPTNEDWMEQFLLILNSAFSYTSQFGKPIKNINIDNISNQLYQLNNLINSNCVYPFEVVINGKAQAFEVVNPDIDTSLKVIKEYAPIPERGFQLLYRNDGAGNSSNNTGFFVYWKQGVLNNKVYNFDQKVENNFINVDVNNINNTDVWFEEIDNDTGYTTQVWTKIPANEYLSYTNTNNDIRTIYKVETRENDQVKVCFPDGYFGDIPYGIYKLWYRVSDGNSGIYIKPADIKNVSIKIPYYANNSNESNVYYLTLTFNVVDASHIRQSVVRENLLSIRQNAPAIYSTQDRMVSNKDYNYFPRSIGQPIKVLKAIERTFAGNSRYIDLNDPTGTYSHLNILATDGYLYNSTEVIKSSVAFGSTTGEKIYEKFIEPQISLKEISNLYYSNYDGAMIPNDGATKEEDMLYYYWKPENIKLGENTMTGGFVEKKSQDAYSIELNNNFSDCIPIADIIVGDMICFQSYTIDELTRVEIDNPDDTIWARVESIDNVVINENVSDETSPEYSIITITEILDTNKRWKIRRSLSGTDWSKLFKFNVVISEDVKNDIVDRLESSAQSSFGLTYIPGQSSSEGTWQVRDWEEYLHIDDFEMVVDEDFSNLNVANWFIRVLYNSRTNSWDIDTHEMKIIFGSADQTSFYFNTSNKQDDNTGYFITDDTIKILKNQNDSKYNFTKDYYYKPYNVIKYADGYVDTQEFLCEAYDGDKDAVIDIPTQFNEITSNNNKDILFLKDSDGNSNYLKYIDLKTPFNINDVTSGKSTEDYETYINSIWPYLGQSGYYYTYHRQNELIPSSKTSTQSVFEVVDDETKKVQKTTFCTLNCAVRLYSAEKNSDNGKVEYLNGVDKTIAPSNLLKYDFVDMIYTRMVGQSSSESSSAQTGGFTTYDDIIMEDGSILTFDEETLTYPQKDVVRSFFTYIDADSSTEKESLSGKLVKVFKDENNNNKTTFYLVDGNTLSYYGEEKHGYLYTYDKETDTITELKEGEDFDVVKGIDNLTFLWKHYPTENYLIDPCSTNIIDMYVLTNTYYDEVQTWIANGKKGIFPKPPSAYELKSMFKELENNKMISDTMVWHPVNYKLIFGKNADTDTHCIFKVIKADEMLTDNEVKKAVIQLIDNYFTTMEAGETFYFTQLSTYIELNLQSMIKTCVIVPTDTSSKFGNLFQIKCNDNEILLSSATLDDVQIISTITKENIRAAS